MQQYPNRSQRLKVERTRYNTILDFHRRFGPARLEVAMISERAKENGHFRNINFRESCFTRTFSLCRFRELSPKKNYTTSQKVRAYDLILLF